MFVSSTPAKGWGFTQKPKALYNQTRLQIETVEYKSSLEAKQNVQAPAMNPEKIGRYNIISELGRGGMATVYRATDPNFEREVAIKVLPYAFLHDPQFRARFEREAKMIAALEHAAIVPVYDFGEEDGQPYIVMRLMSGGSLADKIKDGNMSLEEAVQVIVRLAPALDAAHKKGIIHRDLKPGNILFDQYQNAFLSDFGIARLSESGATLTGSNILGTPAYMSPEQVQGEKDLDGRSDLYSLGVIFYQMLLGYTPYQATTPAKVMMMHILEPVPNLFDVRPDTPAAISLWLEKALAKNPEDRFATASEMAVALQAAAQDQIHPTLQGVKPATAAAATQTTARSPMLQPAGATMVTSGAQRMAGTSPLTPAYPATPVPQTAPKKKARWLPISLGVVAVLGCVIVGGALALLGLNGTGPLAMFIGQPTATATEPVPTKIPQLDPTDTPLQAVAATVTASPTENPPTTTDKPPTETPTAPPPSDTPEPSATNAPDTLVIGGADKIAFVNNNEIWVMNVDGSELEQLTDDGAEKNRLGWTPDGTAVTYIAGKCIWTVEIESGRLDFIACFEAAKYIDDFSISADGAMAAISLNLELFVVPFDRERLNQARFRTDLIEMAECEALAPLKTNTGTSVAVTQALWSDDGKRLAIKVLAPEGGVQVDLIRFTDISGCQYTDLLDEFPATRFEIDGYDETPYIQNFGYDGAFLFSMVSYTRNDGYGDLYFYNTDLHRAEYKVNPIGGTCCYRDPQFSPDGRYIIFAYQPFQAGATTQLYYVPYATIGSGGFMEPIPLPDGFFGNPKVKPQPALRPALTGGQ